MAVRWISDAARELSIPVWDAIALLAKEDEYPLNGLLDEERFQLLKRAVHKVEASAARRMPPVPPPPISGETTSVTTPIPVVHDVSDRPTVIYPPK